MRYLKWLGGLALMALMMDKPQAAALGAARAMRHWYESVAPSLLPFLALMPLLTSREVGGVYERLLGWVMPKLFGLPGAAAPAMVAGMLSGAPAGAIASRRVAAQSGLNRGQLNRMSAAFCGCSPAFLVSGIGAGMLGSAEKGRTLLLSQLLTQLTLALALRGAWKSQRQSVPEAPAGEELLPIRGAALTLLTICGAMMFFGALASVVGDWLGQGPADIALCLMDVPSGARLVSSLPIRESLRLPLLSAMCGFGGICLIAQCMEALRGCDVGLTRFVAIRLAAGMISAGYAALLQTLPSVRTGLQGSVHGKTLELSALLAVALAIPFLAEKFLSLNRIKNRKTSRAG